MPSFMRRIKNLFSHKKSEPPIEVNGKWSIGIYTGSSPIDLQPAPAASNPVLTAADVTDVRANFVADPFMIRDGSTWYMFCEVDTIRNEGNIGKIGMASSSDGFSWKYERIVLEAPFHLSYPYVFQSNGNYFMIPETRSVRSVQLYRADDFPIRWRFEKTLLKGKRFADASIFRYHDRWWMLTDSGNTTLRLYASTDLEDRWKEHPRSPIIKKDLSVARPGGRVTMVDDHIIRYTQDCYPHYGNKVWAFKITELTQKTYKEEKYPEPVIQASGSGWNRFGMHTMDPHQLEDGRWIACVDGFGD
jgi:hypothetical protein